jgi:hypothetical protein
MKRTAVAWALLAALGGGLARGGPYMSQVWNNPQSPDGAHWGVQPQMPTVPTLMGPWGQPVPMAAPYNASPPSGETLARSMLAQSMPLELLQQAGYANGVQLAGGQACGPNGCPPGVGGPGNLIAPPGIAPVPPGLPPGLRPPGAVAAVGALTGPAVSPFAVQRSEVRFGGPPGMRVTWFAPGPDGKPGFGPQYLEAPGRYNFLQASIYRLKLSDIPNHPGLVLYPTLEVVPAKVKTSTFLSHSAVPVNFTEEDFEQVAAGNFVVKVIYLPDPQFQDLAAVGPDEVVSSRLEPGVDPICEAQRRGCILLVVRLGNIDLEASNTPAMDAPNPFCPPPAAAAAPPPAQMAPGLPPMPPQVPYGLGGQMPQVPYGMGGGQMPQMPYGMGGGQMPQMPYGMGGPQGPYGMGGPQTPVPGTPVPPAGPGPVPGMPAVLPPPGPSAPPASPVGTGPAPQTPDMAARPRPTLAELAGQLTPPPPAMGPSDRPAR